MSSVLGRDSSNIDSLTSKCYMFYFLTTADVFILPTQLVWALQKLIGINFGLGNGFDLSGEQFDTRPEDIRCEGRDLSGTDSKILADSVTAVKRE